MVRKNKVVKKVITYINLTAKNAQELYDKAEGRIIDSTKVSFEKNCPLDVAELVYTSDKEIEKYYKALKVEVKALPVKEEFTKKAEPVKTDSKK